MAAELIGRCRCPLCGNDKARLSLAKSQLAVMTCNGCNCQLFARSDISDGRLRAQLVTTAPAAPAEPPAPTPAPAPKPATAPAPASEPAPPMTAPAAPAGLSWGFFGART